MKKIHTTSIILGLALALLVSFGPALAHPIWGNEDGKQVAPDWRANETPLWWGNETGVMPHWRFNGTYPAGFEGEDGWFCLGPYWSSSETPEGDSPAPAYPRGGGYGCGMRDGRGYGRRGAQSAPSIPRESQGWNG